MSHELESDIRNRFGPCVCSVETREDPAQLCRSCWVIARMLEADTQRVNADEEAERLRTALCTELVSEYTDRKNRGEDYTADEFCDEYEKEYGIRLDDLRKLIKTSDVLFTSTDREAILRATPFPEAGCSHPKECTVKVSKSGTACVWCMDVMRFQMTLCAVLREEWPNLVDRYADYFGGEHELWRRLAGGETLRLYDGPGEPSDLVVWREAMKYVDAKSMEPKAEQEDEDGEAEDSERP